MSHKTLTVPSRGQRGLTLVELMVAMSLGLLIALAAVASLTVARSGFTTVDAASQVRDNGRFAAQMIQRVATQSGYKDVTFAAATSTSPISIAGAATNPPPLVQGYNNALVTSTTDPLSLANDSRTATAGGCASSTDTACVNGSDVLVLRYQNSETVKGSGINDGGTVDCAGNPQTTTPTAGSDGMVSILHVQRTASGEPALMCTSQSGTGWQTTILAEGIEGFQVLYGASNVTPNAAPSPTTPADTFPHQYLRADQMVVSGNAVATNQNWGRVRTVVIGLLLRGSRNTVQDRSAAVSAYLPLGALMASDSDVGTRLTPTDDGRLRQTFSFTVKLRNDPTMR